MTRVLKWVLGAVTVVGLLVAVGIFLLMRALAGDVSEDEVTRVSSPDGRLEAVLVERNGGATTSFAYEVHVIPAGGSVGEREAVFLYGAIRNPSAYGANLRWLSLDHLRVEYLEAKIGELKHPKMTADNRTVTVSLAPGVLDASAPPGGMLYNLRGRR